MVSGFDQLSFMGTDNPFTQNILQTLRRICIPNTIPFIPKEAPALAGGLKAVYSHYRHLEPNMTTSSSQYQKFSKTIFPMVRPDSNFSCARRRFSALMGSSRSVSVVFIFPSSIKFASSFNNWCCFIMSLV